MMPRFVVVESKDACRPQVQPERFSSPMVQFTIIEMLAKQAITGSWFTGTACSNMALFRKPTVAMTHGPSLCRIISTTSILCSQLSMVLPSRLQVFSLSQQLSDLLAEGNR